jgi:hypothetical protein
MFDDSGEDTYHVGAGDQIYDLDGNGIVIANGYQLSEAQEVADNTPHDCDKPEEPNKNEDEKTYRDSYGNIFRKTGDGLSVNLAAR